MLYNSCDVLPCCYYIDVFVFKKKKSYLYYNKLIFICYAGNLVTSRGPATAVEFGLSLLEVLLGNEEKVKVAKGILYPL